MSLSCRDAPTTAGLALVSMLMSAPRRVIAPAVGLVEVIVAPAPIEIVPTPSSPVPSAFRSAPRLRVLVPLSIVALAATTRFVRAVTSIWVLAMPPSMPPSVRLPRPSR